MSPNIPQTQRPLMIQLGKETRDNIAVQGMFNADIKAMEDGFNVNGKVVKVEVHNMYDKKASDTYLGCTGAYCDLCIHSKSDCIERVKSAQFFMINRDLEIMNSIFDTLVTEDGDGDLYKCTLNSFNYF